MSEAALESPGNGAGAAVARGMMALGVDLWDWWDGRLWVGLGIGARRLIVMDRWRAVGGVIGEVWMGVGVGVGRDLERW